MGFTIGGIRDIRSGIRRRGRTADRLALAELSGRWGWDVVPGARATADGCSCGTRRCAAPGAHPLDRGRRVAAGTAADHAARLWAPYGGAAMMLPVGVAFDILDVAERAGRRALVRLERMGLPLGPVAVTPEGRAQFFVAPGSARALPGLLYRMGWDDAGLDLRPLGPGTYITAPPSDRAGLGPVRWLRSPGSASAGRPPEARLLLGTLAYVTHRTRTPAYA
ncbi:bifunctional DNA primase/polymerase [Streptomyces albidoflavus]|uniref:bifunctional DNA primase/polymerase n=1 Tax=Streptomyces TaxID=1883 RepID=UPI001EDC0A0D|nr:bifunctional DNA primase/polymerase [Streptomyces sp. NBU3104]UKL02898.1 bifunctional DNA primase/polymerase [Streptomyces sp. NBU3104]